MIAFRWRAVFGLLSLPAVAAGSVAGVVAIGLLVLALAALAGLGPRAAERVAPPLAPVGSRRHARMNGARNVVTNNREVQL